MGSGRLVSAGICDRCEPQPVFSGPRAGSAAGTGSRVPSDDRQEKHPHSAAASDQGAGVYGPYIQGQRTCADPQTGHRGAGGRGTELCEERHGHSGCVYRIGMHLIERSEAGREKVPWNPSRNRCGSVQRGFAGGRRKCRAASGRSHISAQRSLHRSAGAV